MPQFTQLYCEYRAPAGAPVDWVEARATWVAPDASSAWAHFGCWASTRPTEETCSPGRQASVTVLQAHVTQPQQPFVFEAAARARHAAALLAAVEGSAATCPTSAFGACDAGRVDCPAALVLPSVTMKVHPASAACPTVDSSGRWRAECNYVGAGCVAMQVDTARLGTAPFRPYTPRFNVLWTEVPDASIGPVGGLAPCGAVSRTVTDAGTVVLLSQTKRAWVSMVPGEEPASDRPAAEAAASALLRQAEGRAVPCP
jgi:hypothetical protein